MTSMNNELMELDDNEEGVQENQGHGFDGGWDFENAKDFKKVMDLMRKDKEMRERTAQQQQPQKPPLLKKQKLPPEPEDHFDGVPPFGFVDLDWGPEFEEENEDGEKRRALRDTMQQRYEGAVREDYLQEGEEEGQQVTLENEEVGIFDRVKQDFLAEVRKVNPTLGAEPERRPDDGPPKPTKEPDDKTNNTNNGKLQRFSPYKERKVEFIP